MSNVVIGDNQSNPIQTVLNMQKNNMSLDAAKDRTSKFRDDYLKVANFENITVILMSEPGCGKTTFLSTCRGPILIDHFDPKGTKVIDDLIRMRSDIIVRPRWNLDTAYQEWKADFTQDVASGYLSHFGTYAMDTITGFTDAVTYDVTEERSRVDNVPLSTVRGEMVGADYNFIKARVQNAVKLALGQKCDVVVTAHLIKYADAKNNIHVDLVATGKLKVILPSLFTEKWILYVDPATNQRWIIVDRYGRYEGSTQIGVGYNESGNRIKKLGIDGGPFEYPNMKSILEKCGLSIEDKPSLVQEKIMIELLISTVIFYLILTKSIKIASNHLKRFSELNQEEQTKITLCLIKHKQLI